MTGSFRLRGVRADRAMTTAPGPRSPRWSMERRGQVQQRIPITRYPGKKTDFQKTCRRMGQKFLNRSMDDRAKSEEPEIALTEQGLALDEGLLYETKILLGAQSLVYQTQQQFTFRLGGGWSFHGNEEGSSEEAGKKGRQEKEVGAP
jgi:hypothetical protein